MLSEVLDKKLSSTIEGQSLAALITLLDKLGEDCEGLSGELYALHRGLHGRAASKAPSADAGAYEGGRGHGADPSNGRRYEQSIVSPSACKSVGQG